MKSDGIFTARKRSLGQGNIFIGVCQEFCSQWGGSSWGSASSQGGCFLPEGLPPPGGGASSGGCFLRGGAWWRLPGTATAAGGMHPTGMHSCLGFKFFFPKTFFGTSLI